jgi:hypothetical protein
MAAIRILGRGALVAAINSILLMGIVDAEQVPNNSKDFLNGSEDSGITTERTVLQQGKDLWSKIFGVWAEAGKISADSLMKWESAVHKLDSSMPTVSAEAQAEDLKSAIEEILGKKGEPFGKQNDESEDDGSRMMNKANTQIIDHLLNTVNATRTLPEENATKTQSHHTRTHPTLSFVTSALDPKPTLPLVKRKKEAAASEDKPDPGEIPITEGTPKPSMTELIRNSN